MTEIDIQTLEPSMTLREAGPLWLASRKLFISAVTHRDYSIYVKTLAGFFGELVLAKIGGDHIRAYQRTRADSVGPSQINKECSVLQQMLKRASLWDRIESDYQPLPLPKESRGRALSDAEEYRLFKLASLNPNWETCYNAMLLSAHTTAGPGEIRHLQLRDVYLGDGDPERAWIRVREGAKNQHRIRSIPLDREAFGAAERLLEIAQQRGARLPEHYLLPFHIHSGGGRSTQPENYDPARCQTSFRKAWAEMCAAADLPGLRMYDMRHHAITRLAEKAPEQVILKIAGHVSPQMLKSVYSHVRDAAVREAIDSLSRPDGWKPKEATVRKLMPRVNRSKVVSIARKAREIVAETAPEDTSWIDLVGGE
jgi:integrase